MGTEVFCDELLESGAPESPCVRDDWSGWITRATVRESVLSLAQCISSAGTGLVFLFASNNTASLVGLLAGWFARMPVALLDPRMPSDAAEQLIRTYRPDIVLGCNLVSTDLNFETVSHCGPTETPIINFLHSASRTAVHPDLALLLSTSGSTGSPKFVRLARSAVMINALQITEALAIEPQDVAVAHLPMHYSYGLSVITSHLFAGASISLVSAGVTEPAFWLRVCEDAATHFPGVPFHYSVLDRLGIEHVVPPSVRTFTQAGGHLDHQTRLRCHKAISARGGRFCIMYGQTEAGPRISTLPSEEFLSHSTSVGRALRGGTLRIVDENGTPQAPGIEGDVLYEGPNVMMGYATGPSELALSDLQRGRLQTGDRGTLTEDGVLTLMGRTRRFAKVAGLRIALDAIESYFGSSGSVAAIAPQEKIVLYVKQSAGSAVAELVPRLARRMRIPRAVFVTKLVDEIPLKPNGKIDYKSLEQLG